MSIYSGTCGIVSEDKFIVFETLIGIINSEISLWIIININRMSN